MDLDAPDAQGGDFRPAGRQDSRRQKGDRAHRDGLVANPGAGRGAVRTRRGLGPDGTLGQLRHAPAADVGGADRSVGRGAKTFGHQTLRDNVALLDDELLQKINARVAAEGREVFAKKDGAPVAALEIKVDSYVLETDVHFPTDLNLLWDAAASAWI